VNPETETPEKMKKLSQGLLLAALVLVARMHLDDGRSVSPRGSGGVEPGVPPSADVTPVEDAVRSRSADVAALRTYLKRNRIPHSQLDLPRLMDAIRNASERNDLEPSLVLAVIRTESTFQHDAVSRRGAVGLMQLLPQTAEAMADELGLDWVGEHQLLEPDINIELGTRYLRKLLDHYHGDLDLALEAYNRGPTRLARLRAGGGEPPRAYASRVLRRREEIR
jgi:soluble lytic murein transglycosylase